MRLVFEIVTALILKDLIYMVYEIYKNKYKLKYHISISKERVRNEDNQYIPYNDRPLTGKTIVVFNINDIEHGRVVSGRGRTILRF